MPKLPTDHFDCVFYLYKSEEEARIGAISGGTGFFVAVPSTQHNIAYVHAVTNQHVAIRDGYSVIRVNTRTGPANTIALAPEDWTAHPDGDDVCATAPIDLDIGDNRIRAIPLSMFVDNHSDKKIGVGDAVYMLGRFVSLDDGATTNAPVARFGHISAMPYPIRQPTGVVRPTYCLDVHSRSGFSGSPVFVYRGPGDDFVEMYETNNTNSGSVFIYFLGAHCDQFREPWPVVPTHPPAAILGASGMTKVVPSSSVIDLVELEPFVARRRALDLEYSTGAEIQEKPG